MFGERLLRARKAAGLSMQGLGKAAGVSANMIKKYEHNQSMPSSGVLVQLAKNLDVRAEYFFRPNAMALEKVEYRKRASLPKKKLDQIQADILDQAERWQQLDNVWPEFPIKPFQQPNLPSAEIADYEHIEAFAEQLRNLWELGLNPLPELIDLLESKGILVILTKVEGAEKFDGLQAAIGKKPVIAIASNRSGDRQRFTLAHELGHLVLQGRLSEALDEEKACNRFAGAFILPQSAMFEHIGETRVKLESRELFLLKHEFGMSMSAILYRAKNLEILSESAYTKMAKFFSYKGWKKQEPGTPYAPEKTILFEQLVYRALSLELINESKAAELMQLPLATFHQQRQLGSMNAIAD